MSVIGLIVGGVFGFIAGAYIGEEIMFRHEYSNESVVIAILVWMVFIVGLGVFGAFL